MKNRKEYMRKYMKIYSKIWRKRNPDKIRAYRRKYIRNAKRKAIKYKGSKCQICGLKDSCIAIYDFHHINPKTKKYEPGKIMHYSWKKIKKEIDKCNLVCKNCHAKIHFKEEE